MSRQKHKIDIVNDWNKYGVARIVKKGQPRYNFQDFNPDGFVKNTNSVLRFLLRFFMVR